MRRPSAACNTKTVAVSMYVQTRTLRVLCWRLCENSGSGRFYRVCLGISKYVKALTKRPRAKFNTLVSYKLKNSSKPFLSFPSVRLFI